MSLPLCCWLCRCTRPVRLHNFKSSRSRLLKGHLPQALSSHAESFGFEIPVSQVCLIHIAHNYKSYICFRGLFKNLTSGKKEETWGGITEEGSLFLDKHTCTSCTYRVDGSFVQFILVCHQSIEKWNLKKITSAALCPTTMSQLF